MKTLSNLKNSFKQSISIKLAVIGLLILIMLIPAGMIQSLILERQFTRDTVVREISDKWGKEQTLTGPILSIPYFVFQESFNSNKEKEIIKIRKTLYVLPQSLNIKGEVSPEIRKRSIYKVIAYQSDLHIWGNFLIPDFEKLNIDSTDVEWDRANLLFGIDDLRGIQNDVGIHWENKVVHINPGMKNTNIGESGFTASVVISPDKKSYPFKLDMALNGSGKLYFAPIGKTTDVSIKSDWADPSFSGYFLPDDRKVSDSGFSAKWNVLHVNRNFPQTWINTTYPVNKTAFGVDFLFPVDEYQKSSRSAKYAIMFIALTFIIFVFVEILNKKRFHPVQYVLVGMGLLIFFTLLISLSEHIGFNWAYLISAFSVVGLITLYARSVFKNIKLTWVMGGTLTALYTFLFVVLQLQDYSLLMGSIGLFIVLMIIMSLSRKIDWYPSPELNDKKEHIIQE